MLPSAAPATKVPNPLQVHAAATATPFRGRLLGEWFDSLAGSRQLRIRDFVRSGYVQGLTIDEMVRGVRGTRAQGYADGILNIDRRHAESVVRTAVSHVSATARGEFYTANKHLIKHEQWVSTLDTLTTEMCMLRDGLLYTTGDHEPVDHEVPWMEGPGQIHWNCRSVSVPVINAAEDLGLNLPPLERAAMNGVAAPDTTYGSWLSGQSASVQDKVLGPTRGAMLRDGSASFTKFFNNKGEMLTLKELRKPEED